MLESWRDGRRDADELIRSDFEPRAHALAAGPPSNPPVPRWVDELVTLAAKASRVNGRQGTAIRSEVPQTVYIGPCPARRRTTRLDRMSTYTRPRVRDAVRSFNKRVLNPAMMLLAGRRYWYASTIRHEGRKSGKNYATPIVAIPVDEGLVVPLPYGSGVDWLRNVRAAGSATIRCKGQTYHVVKPEVVGAASVEPQLSAARRRIFRAADVDSYAKFTLA